MVKAKNLMSKNIISIDSKHTILDACKIMTEMEIKHLVVVDEGKLVGILSDRDIIKADIKSKLPIKHFMSWPVYVVAESTPLEKVLEEFISQKVSSFVVEDMNKKMKGIITIDDVLSYFIVMLRQHNDNDLFKGNPYLY